MPAAAAIYPVYYYRLANVFGAGMAPVKVMASLIMAAAWRNGNNIFVCNIWRRVRRNDNNGNGYRPGHQWSLTAYNNKNNA